MSKGIPKEITDFIKANGILTLAVSDSEPWVCTLYYGTDEDLNFYLITNPGSMHGKIIGKNEKVAFNIFDSNIKITQQKKGLQGKGICSQVKDIKETAKGLMIWHKANPGIETRITLEAIKKWKDTKIYEIKPTFLKFFNKELYGKKEYGIWKR